MAEDLEMQLKDGGSWVDSRTVADAVLAVLRDLASGAADRSDYAVRSDARHEAAPFVTFVQMSVRR